MVYNTGWDYTWWRLYKYRTGPIRYFINQAKAEVHNLTTSLYEPTNKSYHSFHIKGLCNTRCVWAVYHRPYPEGSEGLLLEWDQIEIPPMVTYNGGVTGRGGKSCRCLVGSTQGGMRETSKGGGVTGTPPGHHFRPI